MKKALLAGSLAILALGAAASAHAAWPERPITMVVPFPPGGPTDLVARVLAKQLTDQHSSTLPQWALAKFISEGYLLKHIRRCHTVYAGRRERILQRLAGDLSPWFEAVPTVAGFHMAALCKVPVNIPLLMELARRVEVGLYPLDVFFHDTPVRPGLIIGFGAIETLDIDPALDKVRDILQQIG